MYIDRRGFLRFGLGGAVTMALSAVAPLLPTDAYAVAGVDDAVVGGVVLVLLTLAGYAVSAEVSQATLSSLGYSFSDFASDASHQSAAVTRAIADANNLGVELQRAQAESAAQAIAAGTGAVGDWFADIADTGKIALDNIVNGAGATQGALWGLIAEFADNRLSSLPTPADDAYVGGSPMGSYISSGVKVVTGGVQQVMSMYSRPLVSPPDADWAIYTSSSSGLELIVFGGTVQGVRITPNGTNLLRVEPAQGMNGPYYAYTFAPSDTPQNVSTMQGAGNYSVDTMVATDLVITGDTLPGVDRAADAPETYGAGYDKTIIGTDAVYGTDGEVVSAGTITMPVDYPYVQLPYVDGLYGLGAGVIPGIMDVPISGATDVVVGTQNGVVSMPITQAIATDTSIAGAAEPSVPVVPPDTPDVGPWQPAYDLPFQNVWPFNMIYQFVSELSVLGGE